MILVTLVLLGVGIWGVISLETRFDSTWFLPPSSYLSQWFTASKTYFPSDGELVTVYVSDIDYRNELDKMADLVARLSGETEIIRTVTSWFPDYKEYLNGNLGANVPLEVLDAKNFSELTAHFLFAPAGLKYQPNFYTEEDPDCGLPLSKILVRI